MRGFSESLPMLLLRSREKIMECFRPILKQLGLTEQQWRVIRALESLESCNAQALARESAILSPSLSRILNHLENRGYVLRRTSSIDQREYVLRLSAKGKRLYAEGGKKIEARYDEIQEKLCPEKMNTLYAILGEISNTDF